MSACLLTEAKQEVPYVTRNTRMRTRRYRLWRLCQKEAKNMVVNKICVHSHYEFAQISDHVAEGQLVD